MAEQTEMRQNTITGEWVILAPSRARRPHDLRQAANDVPSLPAYDPRCPFCPGNEDQLPPIVMEMAPTDGETGHSWQTRVVRNKYPVLTADSDPRRVERGVYNVMGAQGRHEVLIESPWHNDDLSRMSFEEVGAVIETYHRRYDAVVDGEQMTLLFRNHGPRAGASLLHAHSQLVATSVVPPRLRAQEASARDYYDRRERCGYCDMVSQEINEGLRVVLKNESFVAVVPYAAQVPYEIWVVPRRHAAGFGAINDREKADLSMALRETLRRLRDRAGDPDYNFVIHTASRAAADAPYLHWYVRIRPRVTVEAGFEIESGMYINPSLPEDDAIALRGE